MTELADPEPPALARSVAFNVAGQVGSLAVGFVGSILLARWLGPADRGLLGVLSSFASFALMLGGLGVPLAVLYYASRRETSLGALLANSLLCAAALAVVLVPLTFALRHPLADAFTHGRGEAAWVVAAATVPLSFLDYATQNFLLGRLRFGAFNAVVLAARVAGLAATGGLVVAAGFGVQGGLIALAVGSLCMIAGSLWYARPFGRVAVDGGLLRRMTSYGARVQVGALFQLLNYRLDLIVIQFFAPLSVVGLYIVAQVIAELSNLVSSAFHNSVMPLVAAGDDDGSSRTTAAGIRHHGIAVLGSVVGIAIAGPLIIRFAYGADYTGAIVPMLILLPGMWFLGTGTVIAGDLRGRERPGLASALAGLSVAVTVALDALLIPRFDVNGAAIASDGAYVAFGVASLIAVSRISGLSIRSLVVPTVADLRAYPLALRRLAAKVRSR
jgi:O-antigen/teichoic acid export membrane protein